MKKLLLLYQPSPHHLDNLIQMSPDWHITATVKRQDAWQQIMDAEVVMGNHHLCESLPNAQQLKWLQSASAGVDYIINNFGTYLQGIMITNAKGVYDTELSEHALALIFSLYRNLHLLRDKQQQKLWVRQQGLETIAGKNALILGWGSLGKAIGIKLKMLGGLVTGVQNIDGDITSDGILVWGKDQWKNKLPLTDILVLALPLTSETNGLVSAEVLNMLPPNAIVINIGRAATMDEGALYNLLMERRLRGAALDVFLQEPLSENHPAWKIENLIITPHTARSNEQPPYKYEQLFEENFSRYLSGRPLLNIVNIEKGY